MSRSVRSCRVHRFAFLLFMCLSLFLFMIVHVKIKVKSYCSLSVRVWIEGAECFVHSLFMTCS